MIEFLAFLSFLAVSAVAAERGHAVVGLAREELARRKEEDRKRKLSAVRSRMRKLEASSRGRLLPEFEDEYDRLELEERILEADEL